MSNYLLSMVKMMHSHSNCYICGASNATFPLALKDSFTAHTRCKCPASKNLCSRCYNCIEGQFKQCWYFHPTKQQWSKLWGRNWSWLVCQEDDRCRPNFAPPPKDDGLIEVKNLPTREEIREWLLVPPNPPFTICIADSGQKHTYPFAVESQSRDLFPVLFEETLIYCDRVEFTNLLGVLEKLLEMGFSKTEIQSGDYHTNKLLKVNIIEFQELDDVLYYWRGTNLFNLVNYVAKVPK